MNDLTAHKMKKVGDMLKTAREKKNLSYSECYKFIKVHPKYLQALEEGNYKAFSGTVHVKGFLKNYARLLDLNVDEVLAFWRREYDGSKQKNPRIIKPLENPLVLITPTSVTITFTLVLIITFFSYLFYQYKSYTGAPMLEIENPKEDVSLSLGTLEVFGRTDRDSEVFLNGEKFPVNLDGRFASEVVLSDGLNSLNFLARNKLGKETSVVRNVVKKADFQNAKRLVLEVSATNSASTLLIEGDGQKLFDGTLSPDTSKVFEASESLKIKSNNAGFVALKLNGVDLGIFGKEGEAKEQEFK